MQALMAFAVAEAEAAAALGDGSTEAAQQMLPMAQVREGCCHCPVGCSLMGSKLPETALDMSSQQQQHSPAHAK